MAVPAPESAAQSAGSEARLPLGYYADATSRSESADREQQIQDELASELSQTDVAVYAGAAYFRQDDSHYYLSVSLVIPARKSFVQAKDKDNATLMSSAGARGESLPSVTCATRSSLRSTRAAGAPQKRAVQHGFLLARKLSLNLSFAKIKAGAWVRSKPMCKFPICARCRCA